MASAAPRAEPIPGVQGSNEVLIIIIMEVRQYLTRGNDIAVSQRRLPFHDTL
ncbi:hypothetical protein [Rhizobium leguminosarum]|uniref:hypothetical protein n=1 Tax=Rhizobium leguminosarum TaxID=384 RepID=UPI0012BBFFED|nr:hypothetical protein [Rhizobium leguminosarum]WFT84366.1 hypothetical protein QA638_15670 [Rhizobium leguminosarum]